MMDHNMIECELVEKDAGLCVCRGGPTLDILKDIQKAYEERMERVEQFGGNKKLQMQVNLLRSWVGDLVGQNTLLSRAVEELEIEATSRLLMERRRHSERDAKRKICGCANDMKLMNETLHKENVAKDREIMRLNKDVQSYEQTIMSLRNELSFASFRAPQVTTKDAEVMAGMCCTGAGAECGDWEPVKDCGAELREETLKYQERIHKMEISLKSVRALRQANVALGEELAAARRVLAALDAQCRACALRAQFKDDIIREMRRQLKHAKTKLRESAETQSLYGKELMSGDQCRGSRGPAACVRQQPRRARHEAGDSGGDGLSLSITP